MAKFKYVATTPEGVNRGEDDVAGLLQVSRLPREGLPYLVHLGQEAPDAIVA